MPLLITLHTLHASITVLLVANLRYCITYSIDSLVIVKRVNLYSAFVTNFIISLCMLEKVFKFITYVQDG